MCVWSVCACQLGAGRSWAGLPGLAGWTTKGIREAWQEDEGGGKRRERSEGELHLTLVTTCIISRHCTTGLLLWIAAHQL